MWRFEVKNKEKAPSDSNKIGKGFGSRKFVHREAFAGMIEALNALQVTFNCREGNGGGRYLGCLRLTTAYLSTNLESGVDVKTLIWNRKFFELTWLDPF